MNAEQLILPGATLGVFGGGQLGRMFAMAAARMGYRVSVFAPEPDCPAGQVAHEHVQAAYEDEQAVARFAERCGAVTIEFENVPVRALELAGQHAPTRPGPSVLRAAQDRLRERQFLDEHDLPTAAHAFVHCADDARQAVESLGAPVVLKAARFGYDGRGQVRIDEPSQAADAWQTLGIDAALCEAWVDYRCELSVLVARTRGGQTQAFGPIENDHRDHILDVSVVPANVPEKTAAQALHLAHRVASGFALEGLVCVEMFMRADGSLLINELAPRPHNSGHLTIEGCSVSQFEQQVRAMCNLPLRPMRRRGGAAMVNLLGDLWQQGEPDWAAALGMGPGDLPTFLHLYGKGEPRPGRKMGHLTVVDDAADTSATARQAALDARAALG